MRRAVLFALGIAIVAAACDSPSSDATTSSTPSAVATAPVVTAPATTLPTTDTAPGAGVLADGTFQVPAADAFGDPGFHEVVVATATAPPNLATGQTLVVRLRDAQRPDQVCDSEHPLSGCVTVDWSDFEDRANVPDGGVFDNHLTVNLASGPHTFFLSETGVLADEPDVFSPGWPHTALGGSAREWSVQLDEPVAPSSELELRLVLTKFGAPSVGVGYEVALVGWESA